MNVEKKVTVNLFDKLLLVVTLKIYNTTIECVLKTNYSSRSKGLLILGTISFRLE